jgi:hypothetical protein
MTPTQKDIRDQLTADGIRWPINKYGLKVRGKRTLWKATGSRSSVGNAGGTRRAS